MDILIALSALGVILPFWLVIMVLIKLDSAGPIFYVHKRVGKDGKEFDCFKFRTMRTDADPHKLAEAEDDPRITAFGKFLRNTSLDETPQLLNVLFGQMSAVGPRPALAIQVKHFSEEEIWKIKVKPGLTGWTQVNGRNSIPYEKRMELDVWYAKNHSVWLDILILFRTVFVLFKINGDGIYDKDSTSPTK